MNSEEQSTTGECGICLDALTDPVITLPCRHKFCAECLDGWKPKHGGFLRGGNVFKVEADLNRKCPLCRENLPPSREMIVQLNSFRRLKNDCEASGDYYSREYKRVAAQLKILEEEIREWDGKTVLEDTNVVELPRYVAEAAAVNDIGKVAGWLSQGPGRINAESPDHFNDSLLFSAATGGHCNLISILLQEGANVNLKNALGLTPTCCSIRKHIEATFLLFQWGAKIEEITSQCLQENLRKLGQHDVRMLVGSAFGGRRCEIINYGPDMNGKTCIVDGYRSAVKQYKITMEFTNEKVTMSPQHLKQRDRTPEDPGYYIEFENTKTIRRDFKSNQQCQAYVASIKKKNGIPDVTSAEAEAGADKAMEDLLAELGLEEPSAKKSAVKKVRKSSNGKKKGEGKKKKGKK